MKKTYYITHRDFGPDGKLNERIRSYRTLAETLADALRQPIEKEHPLPDRAYEIYRISIWI